MMVLRLSRLVPTSISYGSINGRPQSLLTGMNKFLSSLEITFRRDPTNYRPRINKQDSMKDKEQKLGYSLILMFIQVEITSFWRVNNSFSCRFEYTSIYTRKH